MALIEALLGAIVGGGISAATAAWTQVRTNKILIRHELYKELLEEARKLDHSADNAERGLQILRQIERRTRLLGIQEAQAAEEAVKHFTHLIALRGIEKDTGDNTEVERQHAFEQLNDSLNLLESRIVATASWAPKILLRRRSV